MWRQTTYFLGTIWGMVGLAFTDMYLPHRSIVPTYRIKGRYVPSTSMYLVQENPLCKNQEKKQETRPKTLSKQFGRANRLENQATLLWSSLPT